ncbi:glycosyltransferase [bacterium]|nr:glycosyltransferase [bacterium]
MKKTLYVLSYFSILFYAGQIEDLYQENLLFIFLWMCLGLLCFLLSEKSIKKYNFISISLILSLSLFARYLVLDHAISDDSYRYMWEGYVQQFDVNPYLHAPDSPKLDALRWPEFKTPNHASMTAIYPAFSLLLMKWISYFTLDYNVYKYVFGAFDFLCIPLLLLLMASYKIPSGRVFIYALNPVILFSFAGQAHLDSMMMFFMILALLCFEKKSYPLMWILLALAFCSKYLCFLLVPMFFNRDSYKSFFLFLSLVFICFLPYIDAGYHIFDSFLSFSFAMEYNAFVFSMSKYLLMGNHLLTHLLLGSIALVLSIWLFISRTNPIYPALSVGAMFLIFAPTIHFWYLSLFLPFLCFVEAPALIFWTVSSGLWYSIYQSAEIVHRPLVSFLEYCPVLLLLSGDLFRSKSFVRNSGHAGKEKITVIIPEYNDHENLKNLLTQLGQLSHKADQIIVAHAGDSQSSFSICQSFDVQILDCEKGRGNQIVHAIEDAKHEIILILHCDLKLNGEVLAGVKRAMDLPENIGGCIGSSFEKGLSCQWIIAFLNRVRARFLGISFGDQGQFFRRSVYLKDQWDLKMPLMEDVELSLQLLKSKGKVVYLGHGLESSVRRWQNKSRLLNAFLIIRLVFVYCLKRRFHQNVDTKKLYQEYYLSSKK